MSQITHFPTRGRHAPPIEMRTNKLDCKHNSHVHKHRKPGSVCMSVCEHVCKSVCVYEHVCERVNV